MIRKIIHIDEEKCNGCGLCASACHEGAIDIVDGKAKLVRENFCDGFGDCLPNCPTGAITFEEREAPEYDEAAVKESLNNKRKEAMNMAVEDIVKIEDENEKRKLMMAKNIEGGCEMPHTCPGSQFMNLGRGAAENDNQAEQAASSVYNGIVAKPVSRLGQWPCQIKLLPEKAPFYDGAKLLIAADCTAYAYANMHEDFMKGKVTLIGCPKLDDIDYSEKLTAIIRDNDVKSITIVRMEVPCCGGLQRAAEKALKASGKFIPWQVVTISRDGRVLE